MLPPKAARQQVMPDDHSKLVPLLPIPNRTVKRLRADDSAGSRVKVGHRQALTAQTALPLNSGRAFCFGLERSTSAGAQHLATPSCAEDLQPLGVLTGMYLL